MLNKPDKAGARHDKHEATIVKRVSRRDHDDGHGGAWKVAFADFCLALMCLFLVMWLMAARQQEAVQEAALTVGGSRMDEGAGHMTESQGGPRGSLIDRNTVARPGSGGNGSGNGKADYADAAASGPALQRVHYESASDMQVLSKVLDRLSSEAGLSSNLQAVVTAYGLRVMVHDTDKQGMFERGSWVPTERFRRLLNKMGPLFARMDNQMLVVGHTDSVQYADRGFGGFSNWTLSTNRAMAARAQLMAGGMAANSILQVVGMADRAPLDTRDATAAVNRRIELLILTRPQALMVAAMFGLPGDAQPLNEGLDTALPDRDALQSLRAQLVPSKGSMPDAN